MSNRNRGTLVAMLLCAYAIAADVQGQPQQKIGRLSASFGDVQIKGEKGTRKAAAMTVLYNGETVITGNADACSLLLESKAVVKIDRNTELRVVEKRETDAPVPSGGLAQIVDPPNTQLQLGKGTVVVYLAKRAPEQGTVSLSDTIATIDTTGTVFAATYSPQTRDGVYSCEESSIRVRPAGGGPATVVAANQLARVRDGKLIGVQRLDPSEFRSRTGNLQRLSQQNTQRDTGLSIQRADASSIRASFVKEYKRQGRNTQQATKLADLLIGRCADLDILADKGSGTPGIDGEIKTSDGLISIGVFDGAPDGDVISLNIRSCRDANLKQITDKTISKTLDVFTVKLDVPEIIEINIASVNEGTVRGNGVGVTVSEPSKRGFADTPLAGGKSKNTLRILVTGK